MTYPHRRFKRASSFKNSKLRRLPNHCSTWETFDTFPSATLATSFICSSVGWEVWRYSCLQWTDGGSTLRTAPPLRSCTNKLHHWTRPAPKGHWSKQKNSQWGPFMGPVTVRNLQAMAGGMGQGFRGASAGTVQQPVCHLVGCSQLFRGAGAGAGGGQKYDVLLTCNITETAQKNLTCLQHP